MKKENDKEKNEQNVGRVTHTHKQSLKDNNNCRGTGYRARGNDGTNKNNVGARGIVPAERTLILILSIISIIAIIAILTLIIGRINDNKSLDQIIYNAKKEAEQTLVSTGRVIYAEDVNNSVGAGPVSAQNENLPENTTSTPQGTVVLPKENWNIETVKAISVGNGETIPVPIGFYYVGGDLDTGVIISDEEVDKYDGKTDKTTWEYTGNLKGNQFVWIPCKEEEYKKCEVWNGITQGPSGTTSEFGTLVYAGGWDKTTYSSELTQIRKYEGFYVARYEAGLANTITEFTSTQRHTTANQVYNKEGIPQAKAGVIPWIFIDWNHAQTNSENMYNTRSVSSGLITGTQWDVMLNKMVEKGAIENSDLTNPANWGNYMDNSIEYTGRMARTWLSGGDWYQGAFGEKTTSKTTSYGTGNGDLLTTGASKVTEKYHIFDLAGNVCEWTEENSLYNITGNRTNLQHRVMRGGFYDQPLLQFPVCVRMSSSLTTYTANDTGFRTVLYIK